MPSLVTDRNYWATYRDSIAAWYGELPPPGKLGMERVFEFARHILDTADQFVSVPYTHAKMSCR